VSKGIKRQLRRVRKRVDDDIRALAREGGKYGAGLASEGYAGGYRDALDDVLLALSGVPPMQRGRGWWASEPPEEEGT